MSPLANSNHNNTQAYQPKTRVACIGDSITELSGYPNRLKQALGDSYVVGNFGACGTTVLLDTEYPYMLSRAYALAKEFQPDLAAIMLGSNDANPDYDDRHSRFVADYLMLLNAFKALSSKPKIWVVKPPHVFDEAWLSGRVLSLQVIPLVDEAAKQAGLPVIDVYNATDNPRLFFDGVHPNDEGAKIIAEVIHQIVISGTK